MSGPEDDDGFRNRMNHELTPADPKEFARRMWADPVSVPAIAREIDAAITRKVPVGVAWTSQWEPAQDGRSTTITVTLWHP